MFLNRTFIQAHEKENTPVEGFRRLEVQSTHGDSDSERNTIEPEDTTEMEIDPALSTQGVTPPANTPATINQAADVHAQ